MRWMIEDVIAALSLIGFGIMMLAWGAILQHPEWLEVVQ